MTLYSYIDAYIDKHWVILQIGVEYMALFSLVIQLAFYNQ